MSNGTIVYNQFCCMHPPAGMPPMRSVYLCLFVSDRLATWQTAPSVRLV